jgi:hypothetical protein
MGQSREGVVRRSCQKGATIVDDEIVIVSLIVSRALPRFDGSVAG